MINVTPEVYSVAQLNNYIKTLFEQDFSLTCVAVEGEISNFKNHSSGHWYMTLKDDTSAIRAVMFRGQNAHIKFMPEDGMKVLAVGRVSVFERDGTYQLYINDMMPEGAGALSMAFEQLRVKLEKEGLFSEAHKKPLPKYPNTVGVVTAETGAAFQDICKVLKRRWPGVKVILSPALVQGSDAPPSIVKAIEDLDRSGLCDVMIVGRGGGSIEDLWCFNDESVARAIFACNTPVISGVGHEPDVTIADYVADRRAPTPSAAAELAVPDRAAELERLRSLSARMAQLLNNRVQVCRLNLNALTSKNVMQSPLALVNERRLLVDSYTDRITACAVKKAGDERNRFLVLTGKLDAFSPLKVLSRGYSITEGPNGVVKSVSDVKTGDKLTIKLSDGAVGAEVV